MRTSHNITSLSGAKDHPFGSQEVILLVASKPRHCMQGRVFSNGSSGRFGFNNQEKDSELANAYAFENRIYDSQLAKFLSPDLLKYKLPEYSTYQFALNSPILVIDIKGLFPYPVYIRSFAPFETFGGGFDGGGSDGGWNLNSDLPDLMCNDGQV